MNRLVHTAGPAYAAPKYHQQVTDNPGLLPVRRQAWGVLAGSRFGAFAT